jgi:hypothetical protein
MGATVIFMLDGVGAKRRLDATEACPVSMSQYFAGKG